MNKYDNVAPIVRSPAPILLIGAGDLRREDIKIAGNHAQAVVAADGGGAVALSHGLMPTAVIGDMDSLSEVARSDPRIAGRIHPIEDQDSTDFDKVMRSVEAPLMLAVGFSGGRLDHHLAVLNVLVRRPDRRCIVLDAEMAVFLCPPGLEMDLPVGSLFSLFPMGPVGVESAGLRWPTGGIPFRPDSRVGTSNEVSGPVRLQADGPKMLVLVPKAALGEAVRAVLDAPRWPSP
ncbi:thiamine diphosphokinase [Aestuariibius sp. 2305UL40-4]|uniref:thiamine diphosphokinase n=1 Tax=Aestuariibius violaceus TaxID=3234132 RepID=UPI00345E86F6